MTLAVNAAVSVNHHLIIRFRSWRPLCMSLEATIKRSTFIIPNYIGLNGLGTLGVVILLLCGYAEDTVVSQSAWEWRAFFCSQVVNKACYRTVLFFVCSMVVAWLFNCSAAAWRCADWNAYLKESTNSEVRFSSPVFTWQDWRCCQTCAAVVKWYVAPTWSLCASVTKYCCSMKNDSIFLNVVSAVVCTGTSVCPSLVNRHVLAIKCHFIRKGNDNILSYGLGCNSCHGHCSELRFVWIRVSDHMFILFRWPSVMKCFIRKCWIEVNFAVQTFGKKGEILSMFGMRTLHFWVF
jgi:hypothetical protein